MTRESGATDRPLVTLIVGTRPEAIKMLPVARALAARDVVRLRIVLTGQHSDLADTFEGMPTHDLALEMREQTAGEICERVHHALCQEFIFHRPSLALVQGDTSSALGGALAANEQAIPLGHVEAGLRSFDLDEPWPEERNRVLIDRLSDLLFAPTETSAANLRAEDLGGTIHVTGNTGIDALFQARAKVRNGFDTTEPNAILVTCHRRENGGERLDHIAAALRRLPAELPVRILLPLHTNRHRSRRIKGLLGDTPGITLLPPQGHAAMVGLIDRCWLILTDSGGLQEEGPALGKPVLVMRETTERVESPENIMLVGTDPDRIVDAVESLLNDRPLYARMAVPTLAYGDGKAAERIAEIVERLGAPQLSRTASTRRLSGDAAERPGSGWL